MADQAGLAAAEPGTTASVETHCPYRAMRRATTPARHHAGAQGGKWSVGARDVPANKGGKGRTAAEPHSSAGIHAGTARGPGIASGDMARLTTRRGTIEVPARVTRDIRPGTLFVPFHWSGKASVNRLTIAATDPVSRIPEFKACAVRIEKLPASPPLAFAREGST